MKIIEVIPNPYIAVDKDGVPQGVVSGGAPGVYVGAAVDLVASQKGGKSRFYFPPNKDGTFTRKVMLTGDMLASIQAGELLVTTEEDALLCGIGKKDFLPAEKALEAEKAKALAYYQSVRGKGAKVAEIPRSATTLQEGEELPIQTATKKVTENLKLAKES